MNKKGVYLSILIVFFVVIMGALFVGRNTGTTGDDGAIPLTAAPCNRANPTVSVAPASMSGYPNQGSAYQVYIKNNNSNGCAVTQYNVIPFADASASAAFWNNPSMATSVPSGKYTYLPVVITPPTGTTAGSYPFLYRVVDSTNPTFMASSAPATQVVTALTDTTAPTAPGNLHMIAHDAASVLVGWTASTDASGVAGYDMYVNNTKIASLDGTATYFAYQAGTYTVSPNTTYAFSLKARDYANNVSSAATVSAGTTTTSDTANPSVVSGLSASNVTSTTATISWTAGTDNTYVKEYAVYDANNRAGGLGHLCTTAATTCAISGLSSGTMYKLNVVAYDIDNNRSTSHNINVTTQP